MTQITTAAPARKSSSHPRAAAATVTDVMRPPPPTAGPYDHAAAAAYLMKHAGTTALMVLNARTSQPAGIITEADIARAAADGKDPNDVRVYAVMITRPTGETGADPAPPRWPVASRTVPGWSAWPRSAIRY